MLALDACALHEAFGGGDDAVLIGHDWGALAAYAAVHHPTAPVAAAGHDGGAAPAHADQRLLLLRPAPASRGTCSSSSTPLADMAVPMDDLAFIDRLWADWSPGYDATEDLPHVKDALRDPANLAAAIGYYRATLGGVGLSDDPDGGGAAERGQRRPAPAHAVPARRDRRLHGRRPRRPGERRADARGLAGRDRRRRRPLPPRRAARRRERAWSSTSSPGSGRSASQRMRPRARDSPPPRRTDRGAAPLPRGARRRARSAAPGRRWRSSRAARGPRRRRRPRPIRGVALVPRGPGCSGGPPPADRPVRRSR